LEVLFFDEKNGVVAFPVEPDPHASRTDGRLVGQLYFADKTVRKFRLQYTGSVPIEAPEIHFFNPGVSNLQSEIRHLSSEIRNPLSLCPCPQPAFQGRSDWCPGGNCPTDSTPETTTVTHLIVHHSAGANTANDWAAVVRAIWDFHVNVNGWDDIGYNWLVDPDGVLYEGRGDNRLGAHFCGKNGGTMGVCVMGDYTPVTPTTDAVQMLEELLTWKACDAGIDPLGSAFHPSSGLYLKHISGHRDGCSTSCPGDAFYPTLDNVRNSVHCRIDNGCNGGFVPSPVLAEAVLASPTEIDLFWQDNSDNEAGYHVERATGSNANFFLLAELPANTFTFTDSGVFPGFDYFYRVKAVQDCFESDLSNEVFISTGVTGISQVSADIGLSVFPNPAGERTAVLLKNTWMGPLEILLLDNQGQQVRRFNAQKTAVQFRVDLDLGGLPAGAFVLRIISAAGTVAGRVVVR
jgi:hypothetical protein